MNILQNRSYSSKNELLKKHRDLNNKLVHLIGLLGIMNQIELSKFCKVDRNTVKNWAQRGEMLCKWDKDDLTKLIK